MHIPICIAAGGPKSARLAGRYGDGLITSAFALRKDRNVKTAWEGGVRDAGLDPTIAPIIVEQWAAIGEKQDEEVRAAANKWRFVPKAWNHGFFDNISPESIQTNAEKEITLEKVLEDWTVSKDARAHSKAIQHLFDLGATHVVVHVATPKQKEAIEFFGKNVLPGVWNN